MKVFHIVPITAFALLLNCKESAEGEGGSTSGPERNRESSARRSDRSKSGWDEASRKSTVDSKVWFRADKIFRMIDGDMTRVGFEKDLDKTISLFLENEGIDGLQVLSQGFVERWRARTIPRSLCKVLALAGSNFYSKNYQEYSLSAILDAASVIEEDGKVISIVSEGLSRSLKSPDVLITGTLNLLESPPMAATSALTAKNVFDKAKLHVEPYVVFDLIPNKFEDNSVYTDALSSFLIGEYMKNPDKTQSYLDERGEKFRDFGYYVLGSSTLAFSEIEVAKEWQAKISDKKYSDELGKFIEMVEDRNNNR
jgi:hypothetical protein